MASQERASFAYQPLVEPDAIRLIVLQPAQALSAPLQCNIEHTTLSKEDRELAEHYIALSYVWGDTADSRTVTVDGFLMDVTASLESALCHIRDKTRTLRVWADAICINQSDVAERNQQVRQMASVYSTAHHTIIFLGTSNAQIDSSFDLLQSISRRPVGLIVPPELVDQNALQLLKSTVQKDVLKRAWFTRVWVFQELVLSQNPWVQCGGKRIRWDDLCNFSILAGDGTPKLNITGSGMELIRDGNFKGNDALQRLGRMQRARHAFQDQKRGTSTGNTLLDLLIERRGLGASDARDMIYAHLGLATDYTSQKFPLDVDYSKSAGEVFTELARFFLEMHKDYRILDYLEGPNQAKRRRGLASWAPDWTVKNSLLVARDIWLEHDANYCQLQPRFYLSISNDKTTQLICKGTVIGRVVQIGAKVLSFPKSQEPEIKRAWDSFLVGGNNKIQESEGAALYSEKYRIYGAEGESYDERRGHKVLEMLLDDWAHEIGLLIKAEPWSDELTYAPDTYRGYARALGHMIQSLEADYAAAGWSVRPLQWISAYHFLYGEPSAYDQFNLVKEPSLADLTQITDVLEGRRVCAFDIDPAYHNVKAESSQSHNAGMRLPYEHLVSAPRWTQVGDVIAFLQGSQRTFVIRPSTRRKASPTNNIDKHYELVGQCLLCTLSKRRLRGPFFWDESFALD
jgi:hypothetical protein